MKEYYIVYDCIDENKIGVTRRAMITQHDDITNEGLVSLAERIEREYGHYAVAVQLVVEVIRDNTTDLYRRCLEWYAEQPNGERAREALGVYGE